MAETFAPIITLTNRVVELERQLRDYQAMFGNLQSLCLRLQSEDIDRKRDWWAFLVLLSDQTPEVFEAVKKVAEVQMTAWQPGDGLASNPRYKDTV